LKQEPKVEHESLHFALQESIAGTLGLHELL
jgi:hypothetical protein